MNILRLTIFKYIFDNNLKLAFSNLRFRCLRSESTDKEQKGNTRRACVARAPRLLNRGSDAIELHAHSLIEGASVSRKSNDVTSLLC